MIEKFEEYLEKRGYSKLTPSGLPSTVYDYKKRVLKICKREGINIESLAKNISSYISKYDTYGIDFEYGKKSNSAYINALKRFEEFLKSITS